jgi:hypothetical protein
MVLPDPPKPPHPHDGQSNWPPGPPIFGRRLGLPTDLDEARKFISGYADQQIAISGLQYKGIGQLTRAESGEVTVAPMCQHAIQLPGPPWMIGPCQTLQETLFSYWEHQIKSADVRGPLGLRMYLSFLDRKRLLSSHGPLSDEPDHTYIKHADEGIYQYFMDKGALSAVLDWEWYVRSPCLVSDEGMLTT